MVERLDDGQTLYVLHPCLGEHLTTALELLLDDPLDESPSRFGLQRYEFV